MPNGPPLWLQGAASPGEGFRMLLKHIRDDHHGASQGDKLAAFREGVRMIQQFVGTFTIEREIRASFPGQSTNDIIIFVGGMGREVMPIIAFARDGKVYTGSYQASMGRHEDGSAVFNPHRANLIAE